MIILLESVLLVVLYLLEVENLLSLVVDGERVLLENLVGLLYLGLGDLVLLGVPTEVIL